MIVLQIPQMQKAKDTYFYNYTEACHDQTAQSQWYRKSLKSNQRKKE